MNTVVILVHGYKAKNPRNSVGKLREYFESLGCLVESLNYGYVILPFMLRFRNPKAAMRLNTRCLYWKERGYRVIVASHSNGGAISHVASREYQTPIDVAVLINPALTKTLTPCPTAERTLVFFNRGDCAVRLGKWLSWVSPKSTVIARPWGTMGRVGFQGDPDKRVENVDCYTRFYPPHRADGHCAVFEEDNQKFWLSKIAGMAYNCR